MSQTKNTPGPWKIYDNLGTAQNGHKFKFGPDAKTGGIVGEASNHWYDPKTAEANAEFIVNACNSHDELVNALKNLLSWHQDVSNQFSDDSEYMESVDAAERALKRKD